MSLKFRGYESSMLLVPLIIFNILRHHLCTYQLICSKIFNTSLIFVGVINVKIFYKDKFVHTKFILNLLCTYWKIVVLLL